MLAIRWCVATCVRFTPSGIVLLQNPEAILPLKKGTKVLVAGPMYGPFLFVFWLRLYRALRDYSCGCRGFLEDRMMDIITGRAPPPARAESHLHCYFVVVAFSPPAELEDCKYARS